MELTGAQIVCEVLKREGVEVVFGIPGGANELILRTDRDLVDLRVDRRQRLHLVAVAAAGDRETCARRRRDPELGQRPLLTT